MAGAVSSDYLSQVEATALAGVSASTLLRFAEAGYFRVLETNGEKHFPRQELCEVFGLVVPKTKGSSTSSTIAVPPPEPLTVLDPLPSNNTKVATNSFATTSATTAASANPSPLARQVEKIIDEDAELSVTASTEITPSTETLAVEQQVVLKNEIIADHASSKNLDQEPSMVQSSSDAFKRVLQLQEELINQKESRIQELMRERDWLRDRLEKMEDKADRDQMLLMVESQKVKTMIDRSGSKPGILRLALGWLGSPIKDSEQEPKVSSGN